MKYKKLYLIGFMGCGKTTALNSIKERFKINIIDLDKEIENNCKIPINNIFKIKGEDYFRDLETSILSKVSNASKKIIISTGGGTPLKKENIEIMRKNGYILFLDCSFNHIKSNLKLENLKSVTRRPILNNYIKDNVFNVKEFEKLFKERREIYNSIKDDKIDIENMSNLEITNYIHKIFVKK